MRTGIAAAAALLAVACPPTATVARAADLDVGAAAWPSRVLAGVAIGRALGDLAASSAHAAIHSRPPRNTRFARGSTRFTAGPTRTRRLSVPAA